VNEFDCCIIKVNEFDCCCIIKVNEFVCYCIVKVNEFVLLYSKGE
jgi:hypothetical protein